jgi:hypothetical protein
MWAKCNVSFGIFLLTNFLIFCALSAQAETITNNELTPKWVCQYPRNGVRVFSHSGYVQWRFPDEVAQYTTSGGDQLTLEVHRLTIPNKKCALEYRAPVDLWQPQTVHTIEEAALTPESSWPGIEDLVDRHTDIEDCPIKASKKAVGSDDAFAEAKFYRQCRVSEVRKINKRGVVVAYFQKRPNRSTNLSDDYWRVLIIFDGEISLTQ